MIAIISTAVLIMLAMFGTPLFLIFGGLAVYLFFIAGIDISAVMIEMNRMASSPVLIAIPLFTFAGYIMAESGTPRRLVALSRALFGWLKGGTAIITLISCAFFTAFSGASGVTIIALGGILYPILRKTGYPEKFSLGLLTTSGSLGLLFPPSLLIILYGIIANVSITKLFVAGIVPGLILLALMSVPAVIEGVRFEKVEKSSLKQVFLAFKDAIFELPLPFILIWGIYSGTFAASEAAVITAMYALVVEVFVYRDLSLTKDIPRVLRGSMVVVGGIFVILGSAMGLTNYLVDQQIPMKILDWMKHYISNRIIFLLILNIFLIVVGAMLDVFSAIIVVIPLILPIAKEFGIDPLQMAVIFLVNLEIGYNAPPAGINLFIASFRFRKPVLTLARANLPFLAMLFIGLMLVTYIPDLSLFLVRAFNIQ